MLDRPPIVIPLLSTRIPFRSDLAKVVHIECGRIDRRRENRRRVKAREEILAAGIDGAVAKLAEPLEMLDVLGPVPVRKLRPPIASNHLRGGTSSKGRAPIEPLVGR